MSKDGDYIKTCTDCKNDFIGEKIDTLCSGCANILRSNIEREYKIKMKTTNRTGPR